jgi:hypothetical protein
MRSKTVEAEVDNNFPRMMYRFPATKNDPAAGVTVAALQDGSYDIAIADTAEQHAAGAAEGWYDSPADAKAADAKATAKKAAAKA